MSDLISRQAAIDALRMDIDIIPYAKAREYARAVIETVYNRLEELPSVQPKPLTEAEVVICKLYLDDLDKYKSCNEYKLLMGLLDGTASAQCEKLFKPEPLDDREQRIFLAAMGREEKVCEEVERNRVLEAYEDSLMWVCREIKRKVKGALWT